jgi:hypothetical protein
MRGVFGAMPSEDGRAVAAVIRSGAHLAAIAPDRYTLSSDPESAPGASSSII